MKKSMVTLVALFGLAVTATSAMAAPLLSYRVFEDNVLQGGLSSSSATGSLFSTGSTSFFSVVTGVAAGRGMSRPMLKLADRAPLGLDVMLRRFAVQELV